MIIDSFYSFYVKTWRFPFFKSLKVVKNVFEDNKKIENKWQTINTLKFTNYDYVSPNIRGTIVTATHLKPTIVLFVKRHIYHKSKAYRIIKDWRVAHNAQRLLVYGWMSLQFLSGLHISPRLNNSCYRSISTDRVHRSFTTSTFTTTIH